MKKLPLLLGLAALCAWNGNASAQAPTATQPYYEVQEMNFDMWCQEQQHLPPARCDKRLPADDQAFQAYRDKVESYEIPYLQQKSDEEQINQGIIHYDPLDHGSPTEQNPVPSQPNNNIPGG